MIAVSHATPKTVKLMYDYVYRLKGIIFVAIDIDMPLSEQGPFDIVLHKVNEFLS